MVGILAPARVGVVQFAGFNVDILCGGREDNFQTRVASL